MSRLWLLINLSLLSILGGMAVVFFGRPLWGVIMMTVVVLMIPVVYFWPNGKEKLVFTGLRRSYKINDYPKSWLKHPNGLDPVGHPIGSSSSWVWHVVGQLGLEHIIDHIPTRPCDLPYQAEQAGYKVDKKPERWAIACWVKPAWAPEGHLAIVEQVNDNDTVNLSQFGGLNPERAGMYNLWTNVPAGKPDWYVHILPDQDSVV